MSNIAIVYHTEEGQSTRIAHHIADRLRERQHQVHVFTDDATMTLDDFDAAIVGGSIHMGRYAKSLTRFGEGHAEQLSAMPSAFFVTCLTAATHDEEHDREAETFTEDFFEKTGWRPDVVGIFGGALRYTRYGFIKRHLMRHIAKREGHPTDTSQDHEFTDWDDVDAFADDLASHLVPEAVATEG